MSEKHSGVRGVCTAECGSLYCLAWLQIHVLLNADHWTAECGSLDCLAAAVVQRTQLW